MSEVETRMPHTSVHLMGDCSAKSSETEYRHLMLRELAIWLVGVPVPIVAVIGLFVF